MIIYLVRLIVITCLPCLKHLRVHDIPLSTPGQPKKEEKAITPSAGASKTITGNGDDYVWDIFYRRPGATDEWVDKINVATLYVLVDGFPCTFEIYFL